VTQAITPLDTYIREKKLRKDNWNCKTIKEIKNGRSIKQYDISLICTNTHSNLTSHTKKKKRNSRGISFYILNSKRHQCARI